MSNQRSDWHALADLIAEKVQEYIDEVDAWEKEPFLWVDGNSPEVNLGGEDEVFPGEKNPVLAFIFKETEGALSPSFDKIDDYAAGWFDLRQ